MFRISVNELRSGQVAARSTHNPRDPGAVLLERGRKLNERIIRPLARIGLQSLWIEQGGTEQFDQLVTEAQLSRQRDILKGLNAVFRAAGENKITDKMLAVFRNVTLALLAELRESPRVYFPFEELRADPDYSLLHSFNVCRLSLMLALEMGEAANEGTEKSGELSDVDYAFIGLGAIFHDIGRAAVAPEVLAKEPWDLPNRERKEVEAHAVRGFRLLRDRMGAIVANIALCHHAFLDGYGYPHQAEMEESGSHLPGGKNVHPYSRLVSLANAYEELVSREGYIAIEALEELNCARKQQFPAAALQALNRIVPPFPPGEWVTLSSGHGGVASTFDPAHPFLPRVLLLTDARNQFLAKEERLELCLGECGRSRIVRIRGRSIEHLLPEQTDGRWEDMR